VNNATSYHTGSDRFSTRVILDCLELNLCMRTQNIAYSASWNGNAGQSFINCVKLHVTNFSSCSWISLFTKLHALSLALGVEHNRQIWGMIRTITRIMEKHKGGVNIRALQMFLQFNKSHGIAIV